jgi:hypothetical protein
MHGRKRVLAVDIEGRAWERSGYQAASEHGNGYDQENDFHTALGIGWVRNHDLDRDAFGSDRVLLVSSS